MKENDDAFYACLVVSVLFGLLGAWSLSVMVLVIALFVKES